MYCHSADMHYDVKQREGIQMWYRKHLTKYSYALSLSSIVTRSRPLTLTYVERGKPFTLEHRGAIWAGWSCAHLQFTLSLVRKCSYLI
eukprot:3936762-Amphidinium_carterae.1